MKNFVRKLAVWFFRFAFGLKKGEEENGANKR